MKGLICKIENRKIIYWDDVSNPSFVYSIPWSENNVEWLAKWAKDNGYDYVDVTNA